MMLCKASSMYLMGLLLGSLQDGKNSSADSATLSPQPAESRATPATSVLVEDLAQFESGWRFQPSLGVDFSADLQPSVAANRARLGLVTEWRQGSFFFVAKPRLKMSFPGGQINTLRLQPDVKELYIGQHIGLLELRLGRIEQKFGHQANFLHGDTLITEDHIRSFSDIGLSAQTSYPINASWSLKGWGQFFALQGDGLVLSHPEPFRISHFKRRNTTIVRLAPVWTPDQTTSLGFGVSNQIYAYHLPTQANPTWIGRTALDISGQYKAFQGFLETGLQWNGTEPSKAHFGQLGEHAYVWGGVALQLHPMLSFRQHISYVHPIMSMRHQPLSLYIQPGIKIPFNQQYSLTSQVNFQLQHHQGKEDSWRRKAYGLDFSLAANF